MGLEAECSATDGRKQSSGRAHLGSIALDFRGDFKLSIPLKSISSASAKRGVLTVVHPGGRLSLELGPQAEKWARKITTPRTRMDKLGIKMESRVCVLAVDDPDLPEELRERGAPVASSPADCDFILAGFTTREDLPSLSTLSMKMKRDGAIWAIWPKGKQTLTEDDIRNFGRSFALVDVKVMSFSDTHSALKLVIPLERRR
jgi:hypothetical protein